MPSGVMDQMEASPHYRLPSQASAPFFSEMRQTEFWKQGSLPDLHGTDGLSLMLLSKPVSSSPYEKQKLQPIGPNRLERNNILHHYKCEDFRTKFDGEQMLNGDFNNHPPMSLRGFDQEFGSLPNFPAKATSLFSDGMVGSVNQRHSENGLLSNSLSEMFESKLKFELNCILAGQSTNKVKLNQVEEESFKLTAEIEAQAIGNLLPNDDDLLSSAFGTLGCTRRPNRVDDTDDDIFVTGGGLELDADDGSINRKTNNSWPKTNGSCMGEHPNGEHISRTLIVRNIDSNIEDSELRALFEQYGDVRILYSAHKHSGFVMISYYDMRDARDALRMLQNKQLKCRKLDIQYCISMDNTSGEDAYLGTLVIFDLDPSVTNDDLHRIFDVYGVIKEIKEAPQNRTHKLIEFYDIRAAEAALLASQRIDIAGNKIKLGLACHGEARRVMQKMDLVLEPENFDGYKLGIHSNSPSQWFGSTPARPMTTNALDNGNIWGTPTGFRAPLSPLADKSLLGISSLPQTHSLSSPMQIASVGNHNSPSLHSELTYSPGHMNFGHQGARTFHPQSFPDHCNGFTNGIPYNLNSTSSGHVDINSRLMESADIRPPYKVGFGNFSGEAYDRNEVAAFGSAGTGSGSLHEQQFLWNKSNSLNHKHSASMLWSNSPSFVNNISSHTPAQMHGVPRPPHMLDNSPHLHHLHVGSAPNVNPTLWDRRNNYAHDVMEVSALHPASLGSMGFSGSPQLHNMDLSFANLFSQTGRNFVDPTASHAHGGIRSPQQCNQLFNGRNSVVPMPSPFDGSNERMRSRRNNASGNQSDNKKQYELDVERIVCGEDTRTTLMIKNIPNKYTSKMLLGAIDEQHRGTYDFIYLPIDFKNKCNVGYAFINMINPQHIIPFYKTFNGKKWEKFNSEKVVTLAYARIQGKAALIAHFQNSSLMNEDKRCRPILFHTDGPNAGDQEPFPVGSNIRSRSGRSRISEAEESTPEAFVSEETPNIHETVSGFSKDSE